MCMYIFWLYPGFWDSVTLTAGIIVLVAPLDS